MITRGLDPLECVRRLDDRAVARADAALEAREEVAALLAWLESRVAVSPATTSGRALALVLRLRFLEDRTLAYVSGALGRSPERIRQMEHEARVRLRERRRA